MTSRRSRLQEDTYFRVLRILQDRPDVTQREIAQLLGVSTSGLNYCLNALIDKGWVKVQNFSESKNKFGYVYLLTPSGISEKAALTGRFLQRKLFEYEAMRAEIESLRGEGGEEGKVEAGSEVPIGTKVPGGNNILAGGV
jgi:EPS-associated MarR family transcriptional regulator